MSFIVTGAGQDGPVRYEHADAKEAIKDAVALIDQGKSDVRLEDPTGRVSKSIELHLLVRAQERF
jgi:hypothetical protein